MQLEILEAGKTVFDDDAPQFGQGIILIVDDNMVDVHYKDIEETITYSMKEALKHLNLLL